MKHLEKVLCLLREIFPYISFVWYLSLVASSVWFWFFDGWQAYMENMVVTMFFALVSPVIPLVVWIFGGGLVVKFVRRNGWSDSILDWVFCFIAWLLWPAILITLLVIVAPAWWAVNLLDQID